MKHLTSMLWLIAIFSTSTLQAQNFRAKASTAFTVWTVDGKVNYTEKGSSTEIPLAPGMYIEDNAAVNVADGAAVKLVRNEDIVSISKKGRYSLSGDLINKVTEKQSEATAFFFEKLIASAKFYKSMKSLSDDGSGYGDKKGQKKATDDGSSYGDKKGQKKATDDGSSYGDKKGEKKATDDGSSYGDKKGEKKATDDGSSYGDKKGQKKATDDGSSYGNRSQINFTSSSKEASFYGESIVSWTPTGGNDTYQFTIFTGDHSVLLSVRTSSNNFTFDADELAFEKGEGYYMEVKSIGKGRAFSGKRAVSFSANHDYDKMFVPLSTDPLFQSSNETTKMLMKAATLQKAGQHSEAAKFYKKALLLAPNDPIAKQMRAAFLRQ